MTTKHTPTPWRLCPEPPFNGEIENEDGSICVAMAHAKGHELLPDAYEAPADDISDANAAFIVRAVNHHAAMVEILRDVAADDSYGRAGDPARALLAALDADPA